MKMTVISGSPGSGKTSLARLLSESSEQGIHIEFEYVLLHAPIDEVLSRAATRRTQPSASPNVVRRMHEQFSKILDAYRKHVIETNGKSVRQAAEENRTPSG